MIYTKMAEYQGLSPRVRGNRDRAMATGTDSGSIPARAGEPHPFGVEHWTVRVYPRACGGTPILLFSAIRLSGLSPRVRGNRGIVEYLAHHQGSIPARAGEPSCSSTRFAVAAVYPRACGGTSHGVPLEDLLTGLSPRVRGNRSS